WEAFRRDRYHSPTVVWGRDVNALVAGLARQLPAGDVGAQHAAPLQDALHRISDAVDRSGLRHAELWSYAIENGRLVPSRYGTSAASVLAVGHFEWLACFMLLLLGWLFVPFYLRSGVYTMPEFLERRFNPAARSYFTWVSIIGYVLTKISVTLFAGGIVMREV